MDALETGGFATLPDDNGVIRVVQLDLRARIAVEIATHIALGADWSRTDAAGRAYPVALSPMLVAERALEIADYLVAGMIGNNWLTTPELPDTTLTQGD